MSPGSYYKSITTLFINIDSIGLELRWDILILPKLSDQQEKVLNTTTRLCEKF